MCARSRLKNHAHGRTHRVVHRVRSSERHQAAPSWRMDRRVTAALMAAARQQHSVLAAPDVAAVDATRTISELVRSGVWQEVLPGVVAPAGLEVDREVFEAAAMLWVPRSMLSHESSARRHGFWTPDDSDAHLMVPFADPHRSRPGLRVSRSRHYPKLLQPAGHFRYSLADRTVVDLADRLTKRQLEAVLLSAIRRRATTAEAVRAEALALSRRPRVRLVMEVVELWTAERESLLEDRLHGDVCSVVVSADVVRQHVVTHRDGTVLARLDVAVPRLMLGFEADGLLFHSTDEQIAADQTRDRALYTRGWHIERFREGVLDDRSTVRRDIRAIVERRTRERRPA